MATKLKNAAQRTASFGDMTRVETMVAIEFAASWKPLMTSKIRAAATVMTTITQTEAIAPPGCRSSGRSRPQGLMKVPQRGRSIFPGRRGPRAGGAAGPRAAEGAGGRGGGARVRPGGDDGHLPEPAPQGRELPRPLLQAGGPPCAGRGGVPGDAGEVRGRGGPRPRDQGDRAPGGPDHPRDLQQAEQVLLTPFDPEDIHQL